MMGSKDIAQPLVLLVEDCEITANTMIYALRKSGYGSILAQSRDEVEHILARLSSDGEKDSIHALVSDWHICRDYKGRDVALAVRRLLPGVPVIISTTDTSIEATSLDCADPVYVVHKSPKSLACIVEILGNTIPMLTPIPLSVAAATATPASACDQERQ